MAVWRHGILLRSSLYSWRKKKLAVQGFKGSLYAILPKVSNAFGKYYLNFVQETKRESQCYKNELTRALGVRFERRFDSKLDSESLHVFEFIRNITRAAALAK